MTAMSAIVGTGNIAGVATAICFGESDALFWMWLIALAGMAIKFSEAALAVRYREKDVLGNYIGGPMYYIRDGLGNMCQHRAGSVRADLNHRLEFPQRKIHPVSVQRKRHQTVSLFLEAVDPHRHAAVRRSRCPLAGRRHDVCLDGDTEFHRPASALAGFVQNRVQILG